MKDFYRSLFANSDVANPYLCVLRAFTKSSPAQLVAMTGDLGWHAW
jgi:hypothetical protein